jgi:hypothetical protein
MVIKKLGIGPDPVAKFLVPDWGDIVDSSIGLSYWLASLCTPGGPVRQPYARVNCIPKSMHRDPQSCL